MNVNLGYDRNVDITGPSTPSTACPSHLRCVWILTPNVTQACIPSWRQV